MEAETEGAGAPDTVKGGDTQFCPMPIERENTGRQEWRLKSNNSAPKLWRCGETYHSFVYIIIHSYAKILYFAAKKNVIHLDKL